MDTAEHTHPPKVPPKKTKKRPSIDNASSSTSSTRDASPASSEPSSQSSHTADVQSLGSELSADTTAMVRSLDDFMHDMMDSIAELDQQVVPSPTDMSASMVGTGSAPQVDNIMTTSLPALPSEMGRDRVVTPRPTPRPRATAKKKPTVAKRAVHQSTSSPAASPKPTPRTAAAELTKSHSATGLTQNSSLTTTDPTTAPPTMSPPKLPPDIPDEFSHTNGDEDSIYCNVQPVSSHITSVESKPRKCAAVVVTSVDNSVPAEPIYNNMEDENLKALRTSDMQGFPLPPSHSTTESSAITPLSQDSLNILDPVQYVALWELQSREPPTSSSGASLTDTTCAQASATSQPSEPERKKSVPPIPPRASDNMLNSFGQPMAFTFPQPPTDSPSDEQKKPSIAPMQPLPNNTKPSVGTAEFRNSFLLSLPDDPFANVSGTNMFGMNASSPADISSVSSQSENIYSLADDPDIQRLLPKRAAPTAPSTQVSGSESAPKLSSDPPLYSEIHKSNAAANSDNSSPYILAGEVESWFDNPAASYDSEDTVDEDSDEYDQLQPDVPPKALPVAPSPRTAQTDRHGYLYKQGGKQNNKGWRKRYVTFDGDRLRYFSTEKSRISKRIIPVMVMRNIESDVKHSDSGKFRFRVLTMNRNYLFAAETLADHTFWTQILMQSIIRYRQENGIIRGSIGQGLMPGGTMHSPEIKGYIRLDDNKQYVVIKDGKLCYYKNCDDYQFATAIHEVCLNIASVKDVGKNKLQFTTPYHTYSMGFESDTDLVSWKIAVEDGIASALSDDRVLREVCKNPSNALCADCSASKPHWAVLHLSTVVCSCCAGIHRKFWPFKVKSLRMDVKVWTKALIDLHVTVGNSTINSVWECRLPKDADKPKSTASEAQRQSYIVKKYLRKSFFLSSIENLSPNPTSQQLSQELIRSIKEGLIINVVYLINKGVDPLQGAAGYLSPVKLAESCCQPVIAQYLRVNGAEHESFDDIWNVIKGRYSDEMSEDTVVMSGYLYRMGKKDYPRQWLVLNSHSIKCFDGETDEEPKFSVTCRNIVNVNRHENDKNEPSLEFTCSPAGTTYVYGADEKSIIDLWLSKLHKVMLMNTGQTDLGQDFTKAGHAHCKRGLLGEWKLCWLLIKKRQLYILDSDGAGNEEVDLRKILNLTSALPEDTTASSPAEEKGPVITLSISDRSISNADQSDIIYYIQSDLKQETEKWFKVIDDASKEISPNLDEQQLSKDNVPILIEKCVTFISLHGMKVEGIYRHAGTHSKVTNLLNDLIKGARAVDIKAEDYTVNDVANALKRYLRNLQEPIMSSALYGKWLSAANPDRENHNQKLYTYKSLLEQLPVVNFATLKMLIGHLKRVTSYEAVNKMSSINLATVFGPVLLSGSLLENPTQEKFKNTTFEIKLVDDLITYYQWLFSMDESEMKKESSLQDWIQKIQDANQRPARPTGEFLVGVYINNNMGEEMNMEMPANRTAEDVVAKVAESKRIPRTDGYSLFHVICSGDLERSLSPTEKVLNVNMISGEWSADHRKGCYLCVKEDQLRDLLDHVYGSDICRYSELQFSEKKGWKKLYFELNESHLICYKDKSKTKLHEWELSHLSLYVGVEKKRKPPTIYGVTIILAGEDCSKQTYLGKSICFNTAEEMYTWISAICAQTQDTVHSPMANSSSNSSAFYESKKASSPKNRIPSMLKKIKGSKS